MAPVLDIKQVAATNPFVDARKIDQLMAFQQAMEKAGVMRKADYRLSPPLGIGPAKAAPAGPFIVRMHFR
jgi:hypothetical protein